MKKTFSITITNNKPTCPELAGYELPSCSRCQEDDVVNEAWASKPDRTGEAPLMYKVGYTEARERFEFTERDLMQAFTHCAKYASECASRGIDVDFSNEWKEFIASLRNRTPIAIEVEMVEVKSDINGTYLCSHWTKSGCSNIQCECYKIKPATNPDGTVKVVKWIFNE